MIDQSTFKAEWAVLCERFGREASAVLAARYYQALNDKLDTEAFLAGCRRVFEQSTFFPSPKDIIDAASVTQDEESLGLRQWDLCQRLMEGEVEILEHMDARGQHAVSLLGGAGVLRMTSLDRVPFVRRDFLAFYRDLSRAADEPVSLGPTPESRAIVKGLMNSEKLLTKGDEEA